MGSENFEELKKFLNNHEMYLKKEEFRAILYAMNLMTHFGYGKAGAINKMKNKYPKVTKKLANETLRDMQFKSEVKKEYNKQFSQEMVLFDIRFRKRVEREGLNGY